MGATARAVGAAAGGAHAAAFAAGSAAFSENAVTIALKAVDIFWPMMALYALEVALDVAYRISTNVV
jgi:hypothetical protein